MSKLEQARNFVIENLVFCLTGNLVPPLKNINFSDAWGGPVSAPIDMAPAIGYLGYMHIEDRLYDAGKK